MISMFRESGENDKNGNFAPGPWSMRRVLSFLSFIVSAAAGILAMVKKTPDWHTFIPCVIFAALSLSMLILTSITDARMINAAKASIRSN
jgi:VIT1/CCC1 family predicted Fe2+/Mn2+ transporter